MGKRITGNFDQDEVDGIRRLKNERGIEHASEAVRVACRAGLQNLGYVNGSTPDTTLRKTARRFGDSFALLALMIGAMTFWFPLEMRTFVVAPLAAALACYGIDRGLKSVEPALTDRISNVIGRAHAEVTHER